MSLDDRSLVRAQAISAGFALRAHSGGRLDVDARLYDFAAFLLGRSVSEDVIKIRRSDLRFIIAALEGPEYLNRELIAIEGLPDNPLRNLKAALSAQI